MYAISKFDDVKNFFKKKKTKAKWNDDGRRKNVCVCVCVCVCKVIFFKDRRETKKKGEKRRLKKERR